MFFFRTSAGFWFFCFSFFSFFFFKKEKSSFFPSEKVWKVVLILDRGGKDDQSFNASAYEGMRLFSEEQKRKHQENPEEKLAFIKYIEATEDTMAEEAMRFFSNEKYDLIIAIGQSQEDAMRKSAQKFPHQHFVFIDGAIDLPNVTSIVFDEYQGAFLMGVIASLYAPSHVIGFIGGMNVPVIKRFERGYIEGARYLFPEMQVRINYIGLTPDAWSHPTKAKQIALKQYDDQADVIFTASGLSSMGVFDAAEEKHKYAIGSDSNQNGVKPGLILTSMIKTIDQAVQDVCHAMTQKVFFSGIKHYGIANGGVNYIIDQNNKDIFSPDKIKIIEEIKQKLIHHQIPLSSAFSVQES